MGATYDDLLAVARRTEETGFDAFFRSDHYLTMGGDGLPGPTDAWVTLAGLARETSRIRLGTLMTAATFRLPGPLAISVAQVDQMSGGRVELGIGAGWFERRARRLRDPVPDARGALRPLRGAARGHHRAVGTPRRGRPSTSPASTTSSSAHRRCPSRCRRAASRSSSAAGASSAPRGWPPATRASSTCRSRSAADNARLFAGVREACDEAGRDPASLVLQLGAGAVRRARTTPRSPAGPPRSAGRPTSCAPTASPARPAEAVDTLGRYAEAGAERVYLQVLDLADLDHLDLVARRGGAPAGLRASSRRVRDLSSSGPVRRCSHSRRRRRAWAGRSRSPGRRRSPDPARTTAVAMSSTPSATRRRPRSWASATVCRTIAAARGSVSTSRSGCGRA